MKAKLKDKPAKISNELSLLRKSLNSLDKQMMSLLLERAQLCKKIALIKQKLNAGIRQDEYWEQATIKRNKYALKIGLDPVLVEKIWGEIHENSIACQVKTIKKHVPKKRP